MNVYAKIDGQLKHWEADDHEDIQQVREAAIEIVKSHGKTATVLAVVPNNYSAS